MKKITDFNVHLTEIFQSVLLVNLLSSAFNLILPVRHSFRMFRIVSGQFSMAIETKRDEVVLIIVPGIIVNVMNFDICSALLSAETTMTLTP